MKQIAAAGILMFALMVPATIVNAEKDAHKTPVSRKDAIFGLHFDFHATQYDREIGANLSEDNIRDLIKTVKPDFVQYDCKGHGGYTSYPSKVGTPSPGIINDALPVWRKVTNEYGTKLFIHYSGVLDGVAVKTHPEWARIDEKGNSDGMTTSLFSSYVDELLIPQLNEAVSMYSLDGLWVDGECWGAKLDYSPKSLDAWTKETGFTEAPKTREEPNWMEWKKFHRKRFETYLCHWVDEVHKSHPNLEITSNWAYTTLMPKPIVADLDYISGDYQPLNSLDSARLEARYLINSELPWDLMAWGFNQTATVGFTHKTAIQLKQEAAVVLMQGGAFQIYYQPTRPGYISEDIINTAAEVGDFCRDRKSFSRNNKSIPQVALLFSTETLADEVDGVYPPVYQELISGALHALLESHYSVDVLPEFRLEPNIDKYPLVVIPDSYKLTDSFIKTVTRYVKNGGNLLLMGEKCARLFEPMLGVKFIGDPVLVNAEVSTSAGIVTENGNWQKVELTSAKPLAYRYPFKDTNRGAEVAASVASYHKGKVAAIYGPVAANYMRTHHPYLRTLIGDAVKNIFTNPMVEIDAPYCVEIALKETADGRMSIHMLNTMNVQDSDRVIAFDYIPEIRDIKVKIRTDAEPDKVKWMPGNKLLKWEWKDGILSVNVPKLEIHGAIVID